MPSAVALSVHALVMAYAVMGLCCCVPSSGGGGVEL